MSDVKKIVIVLTRGLDDERSSVAWSIANGALASDLEVTMFLVSAGADWVRKGAADNAHLNPHDPPMKEMIQNVVDAGSKIMVCPPCGMVRGYTEEDLIDGVVFAGSVAMLAVVKEGAATLSF
ncbi:MAG: peroxiredoxin [Rhodospirillaceae bacterium]|jgi:predicted peroxiredoxin|nr:peroxiredoxin [Rhodospirillaceae bacterium]MBT4589700.1 peroxiredoxin [Rhodospirillaceae bacterium]MBT5939067.1 peroxiredoxin [Rhodospirillaceae bacterium]MBT7268066.1 peroxiredoxin [Rhodospirillaceae bacterium]